MNHHIERQAFSCLLCEFAIPGTRRAVVQFLGNAIWNYAVAIISKTPQSRARPHRGVDRYDRHLDLKLTDYEKGE